MSTPQPNIVFIHAESMDGRITGFGGHPAMRHATPNLDSLAESGVVFSNAYTNCPVCNPSRASMWTGKYPHYYDAWNNHEGITPETPILSNALQNAGYRCSAIGPLDYLYGMHSIRDRIGSWTRAARIMRPISRTPLPVVSDKTDFVIRDRQWTNEAIESIRKATDAPDNPFFLYLTTGLVHPAFEANAKHMRRIIAEQVDIPPTLSDLESETHPVVRYIRRTKHCERRFSEQLVREIRHVYFAMIAALDDLVGMVLGAIREAGIEDDTYIIFSSDHGEMAGEHNQILKRTMYEPSVHVPLLIKGPGVRHGEIYDTPVSLVDLYPTILDMAGVDYASVAHGARFPDSPAGESLYSTATGASSRNRDWAFCEYNGDRCCTGAFMLRQDRWKYVRYEGEKPQLFDLSSDRWESTDLASSRPEVVSNLDALLRTNFDCAGIDERAKRYDRESFLRWREKAGKNGVYAETMARVYSGFDRLCIEDIVPWREEDEEMIAAWLGPDY